MKNYIIIISFFVCFSVNAQQPATTITGRIYNAKNNEPVEFATIVIQNTTTGTNSDATGNFVIKQLVPGFYQLKVSAIGY